jgi:hypothetical protein
VSNSLHLTWIKVASIWIHADICRHQNSQIY